MKLFVIALLLAGLGMAFTVEPDYIEIQDTGSQSLPTMDVGLSIDCDTKDLTVMVQDSDPIENADTVLFYTDYGYQPLPNPGKTGADGIAVMSVPGTLDFLTGLFIIRVDHQGHQSREVEFTYEKCFEPPPEEPVPEIYEEIPPEEPEPELIAEELEVPEQEPEAVAVENESMIAPQPQENESEPVSGEVVEEEKVPAESCPLGIILLSLLIFKARENED